MALRLIFARALEVGEDGYLESYWPERWPLKTLLDLYLKNPTFFGVSYLNDVHGLQGNMLSRAWLKPYLPEDLIEARKHGRGVTYTGVDTGSGGTGKDPDYCAAVKLEVIDNKGFLVDKFNKRLPLEQQAQFIEDWVAMKGSDFLWVEDITTRGYVWKDLSQHVNDGKGSYHSFQVWVPSRKLDKRTRYLSIAPRFEAGQVRIPGIRVGDSVEIHPDWNDFVSQWTGFPAKHDDLLDATYLAVLKGLGEIAVASVVLDSDRRLSGALTEVSDENRLCERKAHVAFGRPVTECGRCMLELANRVSEFPEEEQALTGIGAPMRGLFH